MTGHGFYEVPTVPGSIRDTGGNPRKWTIMKHQWAEAWILLSPLNLLDVRTVPSHRAAIRLMDRLRRELADTVAGVS